ncbi:hypothetical protein HU200_045080 [Digitaria exilis]|uniref:cysteine dioxygenase n=1 Tax=Digitaria exilis TaxID=1010633 RepID=A0A835B8F2_9POAL|nr:hypothetical protein HU200_045080 [Digitaria exilis]
MNLNLGLQFCRVIFFSPPFHCLLPCSIKHQALPTTTVGGGSKAPPPRPSLFHYHAYLLVADLNVVPTLYNHGCSLSSTRSTIRISPTLSATDTPPRYYRRIGYLPQPKLGGACSCRCLKPRSLLPDDVARCSTSLVPGLPSCALPVVVSRSMATMGKSAAEQAGREAMVVATASLPSGAVTSSSSSKRKRDTEETESGSDEPQQVEQPTSPAPAHHAVLRTLPSLQGLVDVCRYELDGSTTPPTAAVVRLIRFNFFVALLLYGGRGVPDKIGPDDVGLGEELRFFNEVNTTGRKNEPIISCKPIFQCKNFEIAVFFLPQGTVMPLHDHPGMTVFSKLLIGSAHIEGYDWIRGPRVFSGPGSSKLAEKVLDKDVTEDSGAWVSFPDAGGNMRRFVAGAETHCAFLDIRTPPSSIADRRRCTFYKDIPMSPAVVSTQLQLLASNTRCLEKWADGGTEARGAAGMVAQDG